MAIKNEFMPRLAIHPGRMLLMEIEARQMTQKEFAERIGLTAKNLSEIVNGKADISVDIAIAISAALGTSAQIWLNLQNQYDEILAQQRVETELKADLELLERFPYRELRKLETSLPNTEKKVERVTALRSFLCVSSLQKFDEHMDEFTIPCAAFRTTGIAHNELRKPDRYSLGCWIRKGQLLATSLKVPEYDEAELKKAVPLIRKHSANPNVKDAWKDIEKLLIDCGVKIVLVPYLPKTYVNGAMYWQAGNPVIILNAKTSYWDTVLFSLLHEIGHILCHGKRFRSVSFDKNYSQTIDQQKELEADDFATEALLLESEYNQIVQAYQSDRHSIELSARQLGIDVGVAAGRMAYNKVIPWSHTLAYRRKVEIATASREQA